METNLKDALRRYFSPDQATAYAWPCEMHEQPLQRSLDAGCIARAYWHGRREDDDEPAHADWLLASGFTKTAPAGNVYYDWPLPKWGVDKEFILRFHPDPQERAESWTVEVSGVYADDAPSALPGQTYGTGLLYQRDFTRGQVRELCRALRAPLADTH